MNISEIDRLAGVSSAAVSRYFNHGYISETKREAIRKVVEETGFRPLMQAQTLRTKKTMMVGVVAPKMASYSIGQIVDGILNVQPREARFCLLRYHLYRFRFQQETPSAAQTHPGTAGHRRTAAGWIQLRVSR